MNYRIMVGVTTEQLHSGLNDAGFAASPEQVDQLMKVPDFHDAVAAAMSKGFTNTLDDFMDPTLLAKLREHTDPLGIAYLDPLFEEDESDDKPYEDECPECGEDFDDCDCDDEPFEDEEPCL